MQIFMLFAQSAQFCHFMTRFEPTIKALLGEAALHVENRFILARILGALSIPTIHSYDSMTQFDAPFILMIQ